MCSAFLRRCGSAGWPAADGGQNIRPVPQELPRSASYITADEREHARRSGTAVGADRPGGRASHANLAYAYHEQAWLTQAVAMHERTLAIRNGCLVRSSPYAGVPRQSRVCLHAGRLACEDDPSLRTNPCRLAATTRSRSSQDPALQQLPCERVPPGGTPGRSDPTIRTDPRRPAPAAWAEPSQHLALQPLPRQRLPRGGAAGRGHPALRADSRWLAPAARPRTPCHPALQQLPCRARTARQDARQKRPHSTSKLSRAASRCWAAITL